ncbi:hypothetical protein B0H13DRAFT_1603985, partial [Mycena leptocephala]
LTSEEYDKTDIKTLKMKALEHLARKGHTLGVGQSDEPETMFHNPQLYPQMFPWLFHYGLGTSGVVVHCLLPKITASHSEWSHDKSIYHEMGCLVTHFGCRNLTIWSCCQALHNFPSHRWYVHLRSSSLLAP